ncbi:MAG: hypothetical protein KME47_10250 [Nodosilinea sp. WJT8-NPBG4]|nr:hypothetical protein [Nodosilinea sp. WJT8-NPBG4]
MFRLSLHSNRRTWAPRLDKAGVWLKAIQALDGWSSMVALQRYLEISEGKKVEAIAPSSALLAPVCEDSAKGLDHGSIRSLLKGNLVAGSYPA